MEESYKLVSFKEFIARVVAFDFHDPLDIDWAFAEDVLDGRENFVYGKEGIDTIAFEGSEYFAEYESFMLDPYTWLEANEQDRNSGCIGLIEELLKEYNL